MYGNVEQGERYTCRCFVLPVIFCALPSADAQPPGRLRRTPPQGETSWKGSSRPCDRPGQGVAELVSIGLEAGSALGTPQEGILTAPEPQHLQRIADELQPIPA